VRVYDFIFLEGFQVAEGASANVAGLVVGSSAGRSGLALGGLDGGQVAFDEIDPVGVDDAVVSAFDFEVVGDEIDWAL